MAIKINGYKNGVLLGEFDSIKSLVSFCANDLYDNGFINGVSGAVKADFIASVEQYNEKTFILLNDGNYFLNNMGGLKAQRLLSNIGVTFNKLSEETVDDDELDALNDNVDVVVNENCHLHHILPKSAYGEFKDLNKFAWNGIRLPKNLHSSYHAYMGGFDKSNNVDVDWAAELFKFLNKFIDELGYLNLSDVETNFYNGLNSSINKLNKFNK